MAELFSELEKHRHNGLDAPRLDPRDFKGFPILTAAPAHNAKEGEIMLANVSGTYKLYAFINGGWRSVTLT